MLPVWNAAIAFGLVSVPVKVYSATEDRGIRFRMVHNADAGQIRYDRKCDTCGRTIDFLDIDRAYSSPAGDIVLTDADFAGLPAGTKNTIDVLAFVPNEQIDPVMLARSYYLEPSAPTPKAYVLLATTLQRVDRTAIVTFTLREKTRLAALRIRDGVIILQTLLWPDEIREPPSRTRARVRARARDATNAVEPGSAELAAARALVDSLSGDYHPADYTDTYRTQLKALLDDRIAAGDATPLTDNQRQAATDADQQVTDLLAALQRSIRR